MGTVTQELGGSTDVALVIAGINDFIQHVGAATFARDTVALAEAIGKRADRVAVLEIIRFDERKEISGPFRANNCVFRALDRAARSKDIVSHRAEPSHQRLGHWVQAGSRLHA